MKTGPKGAVEPIRSEIDVERIKATLRMRPRDYCLFTLGCNSALRASDILKLDVGDVRGKKLIQLKEKKTGKAKVLPLNPTVQAAIAVLCSGRSDDEPLFVGEKRGTRLTVCTLSRLWKKWCCEAGLKGNYASHSGRKTAAYTWHVKHKAPLSTIMVMLNHTSEATTAAYIGITREDITKLYDIEI